MTDNLASDVRPRNSAAFLRRTAFMGTCAGVVLGGWCLWLGIQATSTPAAVQARQDRTEDAEPAAAAKTRPLAVRITDITDSGEPAADVIHAVVQDEHAMSQEITVANFSATHEPTAGATAGTSQAALQTGAWLTGAIETLEVATGDPQRLSPIPAFKRKTKSLRDSRRFRRFAD